MTTRRRFLQLLAGAALTPVLTSVASALPSVPVLYGDGVHDDTDALAALLRGDVVEFAAGLTADGCGWIGDVCRLPSGRFKVNRTIVLSDEMAGKHINFQGATIDASNNDGPIFDAQFSRVGPRATLSHAKFQTNPAAPCAIFCGADHQ